MGILTEFSSLNSALQHRRYFLEAGIRLFLCGTLGCRSPQGHSLAPAFLETQSTYKTTWFSLALTKKKMLWSFGINEICKEFARLIRRLKSVTKLTTFPLASFQISETNKAAILLQVVVWIALSVFSNEILTTTWMWRYKVYLGQFIQPLFPRRRAKFFSELKMGKFMSTRCRPKRRI